VKHVAILGSTGSIGVQSLDVIRKRGYRVTALAAHRSAAELEKQVREFRPACAAMLDEAAAAELRVRVADTGTRVLSGPEGVCECAGGQGTDVVINAIVGLAGLRPTLRALGEQKTVALANKETLVAGGHLVTGLAKQNDVSILPVDSEHSAIFQCLEGRPPHSALKRIILTASGGPFFGKSLDELRNVSVEDALRHPNWAMGAKITVDSATMFNKGLELIEAVWLFSVPPEDVDVVVHRESIVHSLIEYDDNSVIAQLGLPDMRIPIQYALTYPERYPSPVGQLNLAAVGKLTFFEPDYEVFDCLNICREAIARSGLFPAAVNGANEQANQLFREGKIPFLKIQELVRAVMEIVPEKAEFSVEDVESIDSAAREFVNSRI
jgi:1-deoxy-D-xylulose-5-phosphate reductoisomerase